MTAFAVDPTSIKVMWNEPPLDSLNGVLVGYRIKYGTGDMHDTLDTDGSMREVSMQYVGL